MSKLHKDINSMPKIELHLHLEGSLRAETLFRLAQRNKIDLGVSEPNELESRYQFVDFQHFAELFITGLSVLKTVDDFADATFALARELAGQNVRYAEITSTPFHHHRRGVKLGDYAAGLNEGRRRALKELNLEIAWVCDISRESEDPDSQFTADFILSPDAPEGLIGIGLGGLEEGFPPHLFKDSFQRVCANGLASLPHAGEIVGPESIWGAINELNAKRIGHGISCLSDKRLVDTLLEKDIPLEVSMTSNVCIGVAEDLASHPLSRLLKAGITVTLNTDDPAYFQTTLDQELLAAHQHHGLSLAQLKQMQLSAMEVSCAGPTCRAKVLEEINAWTV